MSMDFGYRDGGAVGDAVVIGHGLFIIQGQFFVVFHVFPMEIQKLPRIPGKGGAVGVYDIMNRSQSAEFVEMAFKFQGLRIDIGGKDSGTSSSVLPGSFTLSMG